MVSAALAVGGRNIRGADVTVNGMVQNAVTALDIYNNSTIKKIVSGTSFEITDKKPQAIFLIAPDEDKSKNSFISLFVSIIYKELISIARSNDEDKLLRPLYYILDEFGNIPKIPSLDAMVTVSAGRQIYFLLVFQSYKQIEKVHGRDEASVILGNCAYRFYLLTNDHSTAEEFSKKLGEKEIQTTSSSSSLNKGGWSSSSSISSRTRRLMDANELMRIKEGKMITSQQRDYPLRTKLVKYWEYPRFNKRSADVSIKTLEGSFESKHVYKFVEYAITEPEEEKDKEKKLKKPKKKKSKSTPKKKKVISTLDALSSFIDEEEEEYEGI